MPVLADDYYTVAMDTLGYGKSDKPPADFPHEAYARTVVDFLKTLDIAKVSIVGHLTGAAIAVEIAAGNPSLVDKLVLIDLPFYSPEMRKSRQADPGFRAWEIKPDGSHITEYWQRFQVLTPDASE